MGGRRTAHHVDVGEDDGLGELTCSRCRGKGSRRANSRRDPAGAGARSGAVEG